MALSGKISGSYSNYYDCELRWSATQNITNNTSTIKLQWYFIKAASDPYGSFNNNNTSKVTLNIAGSTYTKVANFDLRNDPVGTELLLASYSKTITHNSDGTKSVSISGTHATNIGLDTKTLSGTANLNTIPRASSVSASNMTMGSATTITVTKKNSGFTHRIYYTFGKKSNVEITSGATGNTSIDFTPPLSLASEIPSATSATITIKCVTYNSGTQVGTATKSVRLSVPASVKPSVSSVTLAEAVSAIKTQFGAYIQGQSKISGTVNATTAYGSAIASYRIEINGATYTAKSFTTAVLKSSGSQTIRVVVTDKRGRTSNAYTATYNVLAYETPKITSFRAVRYKDASTQDDEGEFVKVFISGTISALSNKNTRALGYQYRLASGTTYTEKTATISAYSFNFESELLSGFNSASSYIFETSLTDYFTTAKTTFTLPTAFSTFDVLADGTGVAFGKVAEEQDCFDVGFHKVKLGRRVLLAPETDSEKQIRFTNTATETDAANSVYAHNIYIYGGRKTSPISWGVFDYINSLRALAYQQHVKRLTTEAEEFNWKGKSVDRIIESTNSADFTSTRVWGDGYCVICGNVTITPDEAGTAKTVAVKFGKTFKRRPNVQVTANTGVPGSAVLECSFTNLTTTGMDVALTRNSTASTGVNWRVEGFIDI